MDSRTERAILRMTNRFREPISLATLAADAALSPFHLHRLFKADTGQTPAAYLNRIRLEYAAHLMVVLPDAPLLQIAIESGFASATTFARAFRKRYGQSASGFRRGKRLEENVYGPKTALSLVRLPSRRLRVMRCALNEEALNDGYARLLHRARTRPDGTDGILALGVFVDAPFHQARETCRHYLALEHEDGGRDEDALDIPGGLYARVLVSGDLNALSRDIVRFKFERLDPSPYAIGSTLAFERIALPADGREFDYRRSLREVFIKVRRKHEPAL